MKVSSDALTFNDLLEEAQSLQAEYFAAKEPIELGPEPEAVRLYQEGWKARLEGRPSSRRKMRLRKGDPDFSALPMDARMWLVIKGMDEQRKDPFHFSKLSDLLEYETWKPRDAMLILAGVDPGAAIVEWSYENFLGAEIQRPRIRRAMWFAEPSDLYDYPLVSEFDESTWELKNKIRAAQSSGKAEAVTKLEARLREIERWANDETSCFLRDMLHLRSDMLHHLSRRWFSADHDPEAKHSPEYFVRWAEARGFVIEWAAWARERRLIDVEPPATEPPYFDADGEDYPELLHIAVRAWDYARKGNGKGTPKQRVIEFVTERYPHLSDGARDAIALVANWQKTGGRPKTGG